MNTRVMELELGLGLPEYSPMMMKGVDLNSCSNEMEIDKRKKGDGNKYNHRNSGICVDDDGISGEEEEVDSKSLSLLLWSGQPNDEDQGRKWRNLHVDDDEERDEDEEKMAGWPPINWLRREMLHHHHDGGGGGRANRRRARVRKSMYVKVKMEGVPIGRKIDLTLYNSYQALTHSLINMFAKYIRNDSRSDGGNCRISYQGREGDWMLAGDAPWETFVESVQRIEILRNAN